MDEQLITKTAQVAIADLKLDCRVIAVTRRSSKDKWCIQFSDKYGQFCDEFHNESGQDNSPELIREKIKSYLFKKGKPTASRRRGQRVAPAREQESGLLSAPFKVAEEAVVQTAQVAGEVVDRASGLTEKVLKTAVDVAQIVSATASEVLLRRVETETQVALPAAGTTISVVSDAGSKADTQSSVRQSSKAARSAKKSSVKTKTVVARKAKKAVKKGTKK